MKDLELHVSATKLPVKEIERQANRLATALDSFSIVKENVDLHGGSCTFEPPPGDVLAGRKLIADEEVIRAMSGGIFRMYGQLVLAGEKEAADAIVREFRK